MRFLFRLDLNLHACAEFFFGILIFATKHSLCPTYKELGGFFIKKKKTPELELRIQIMMIRWTKWLVNMRNTACHISACWDGRFWPGGWPLHRASRWLLSHKATVATVRNQLPAQPFQSKWNESRFYTRPSTFNLGSTTWQELLPGLHETRPSVLGRDRLRPFHKTILRKNVQTGLPCGPTSFSFLSPYFYLFFLFTSINFFSFCHAWLSSSYLL